MCDTFETNEQQGYPKPTARFASFGMHASA